MRDGLIVEIIMAIYGKKRKAEIEEAFEKRMEIYKAEQELILNGSIDSDRIDFFPDRKELLKREKNWKFLILGIFFSILFIISWSRGFFKFMSNNDGSFIVNFWGLIGLISIVGSVCGYMYCVLKYKLSEKILSNELYYDTTKNILFFIKHSLDMSDYNLLVEPSLDKQVIYSIENITSIQVENSSIVLLGDIFITSFDDHVNDMSYIENIAIDQKTEFFDGKNNISMYTKRYDKVKIPRGYSGFEKFLILKRYLGSEKLK